MATLQSLLKGPAEGGTVRVPLSAMYREWNWSSCGTGTDVLWQWQRWHLELLLTWTRSWILWEIRFWDPLVGNGAMSRTTLERPLSAPTTTAAKLEAWSVQSLWEKEHTLPRLLTLCSSRASTSWGALEAVRLLPTLSPTNWGCIDVNSGALEVSHPWECVCETGPLPFSF